MTVPQVDTLALIEHRLASVEENHHDLRDAIRDLTSAINKLAIIDERQVQSALVLDKLSNTVDKAHTRIDGLTSEFARALEKFKEECNKAQTALETRMDSVERDAPINKQTYQWVSAAVWGAAGLAVMYVAKKAGLV